MAKNLKKLFKVELSEAEKRFRSLMMRNPIEGDPVIFESYFDSRVEFKRNTIRTMIYSEIPHHLIYIFDKTGFILSEENRHKMPEEDLIEIEMAFDEYFSDPEINRYKIEKYIDHNFENCLQLTIPLYIIGNYIDRNFNNSEKMRNYESIVFYYIVLRSYRLIRSIWKLNYAGSVEEKYILLRGLFENYCKLCYIEKSKERAKILFDIDYGLANGDFNLYRRDGKIIRSKIIRKDNGEIIDRNIPFFTMISFSKISDDCHLFEPVYEFLSSYAHSGTRHIFRDFNQGNYGFDVSGPEDDEQASIAFSFTASMIIAIFLQVLHRRRGIDKISKRDIEYYCYVSRVMARDSRVSDGDHLLENERLAFQALLDRMKVLPRRRNFR